MPIYFIKLLTNDEPNIVEIKTITRATVSINFFDFDSICKHKAKAITPRIIPLNQHTFNYLLFIGNGFRIIL